MNFFNIKPDEYFFKKIIMNNFKTKRINEGFYLNIKIMDKYRGRLDEKYSIFYFT
ncbi:hypothetical protein GCM10011312_17070 [Planktosalinus lacus]|uniref:Uncharacterized protein n=1 Tax=Planktosalinus lacus TaxID=1526573 RepID=A0A8J2VB01_9FLAO|nr:hypothetical protein GCM10011312_17070 [Planktosalinus lacus]